MHVLVTGGTDQTAARSASPNWVGSGPTVTGPARSDAAVADNSNR